MTTLYLTQEEQKLFDALNEQLREGWNVVPAVIAYEDSYQRLQIRCSQMVINDPSLETIKEMAAKHAAPEAIVYAIEQMNLSSLSEADMRELLYGLGPDLLGIILQHQLRQATTDDDILQAASYSTIRNLFFNS